MLEIDRFKLYKHSESICKHKNLQIFQEKSKKSCVYACIYSQLSKKLELF